MLLVGYCFGIWSERRLSEEVHLNLAYVPSADRQAHPVEPAKAGLDYSQS